MNVKKYISLNLLFTILILLSLQKLSSLLTIIYSYLALSNIRLFLDGQFIKIVLFSNVLEQIRQKNIVKPI
jgi:hypothetical protein